MGTEDDPLSECERHELLQIVDALDRLSKRQYNTTMELNKECAEKDSEIASLREDLSHWLE